jgi:tRNA (cmo5U34)-methyltransferase
MKGASFFSPSEEVPMSSDKGGHDWLSPEYVDEWVNDWSARDERHAQLRRVAVALPFARDEAIRVLDIGSGWGPLSQEILTYRPRSTVTLMDFSLPILEHARARLVAFGDRARYEQRDLRDPDWWKDLGGSIDAVVSSLAIHNLREPQAITGVYAAVRHLLRPHGCFFNLELVFPAGPSLATIDRRVRADEEGSDPDAVGPVEHEHGDPRSLGGQLDWLRTAGFAEVDCLWREGYMALLCGAG